jgi:p-hydroxybenzoate 3-monooxygenase
MRLHRRLRRLPRRLPPVDPASGAHRPRARYPFAWLGILAARAPSRDELVYATTSAASRSSACARPTLTRLYLQVPPDERIESGPTTRIWEELHARLAARTAGGPTRARWWRRA